MAKLEGLFAMLTGRSVAAAVMLSAVLFASTGGRGDPEQKPALPTEAYYVIGIAPSYADVEISTGEIGQDGNFHQKRTFGTLSNTFQGVPENGYLFVKVQGEPTLAMVTVELHDGSFPKSLYSTCEKAGAVGGLMGALFAPSHPPQRAMMFIPPAGKVSYIGSVSFTKEEDPESTTHQPRLVPHYQNDLEGARAFMRSHHPDFADRLEQGTYTLTTTVGHCF